MCVRIARRARKQQKALMWPTTPANSRQIRAKYHMDGWGLLQTTAHIRRSLQAPTPHPGFCNSQWLLFGNSHKDGRSSES